MLPSRPMKNNRTMMNQKARLLAIVVAVFTSLLANVHAGGFGFTAEVVSLTESNKAGEHKMVLLKHVNPVGSHTKISKPVKMVVHLRYRAGTQSQRTQAQYDEAITLLKKQLKKGGKFQFGIMGSHGGMTLLVGKKMKGKKNEYQSNGLVVHSGVAYSYN